MKIKKLFRIDSSGCRRGLIFISKSAIALHANLGHGVGNNSICSTLVLLTSLFDSRVTNLIANYNSLNAVTYKKLFNVHKQNLVFCPILLMFTIFESSAVSVCLLVVSGLDDWDIIQSSDVSYYRNSPYSPSPLSPNRRRLEGVHGDTRTGAGAPGPGETKSLLQNPLEETLSRMTRALNMGDKRDHGLVSTQISFLL